MSGIIELPEQALVSMESTAWAEPQCLNDLKIIDLINEIRRLREVIKKRNHCVDCGKLNPIDNVCDECLEEDLR